MKTIKSLMVLLAFLVSMATYGQTLYSNKPSAPDAPNLHGYIELEYNSNDNSYKLKAITPNKVTLEVSFYPIQLQDIIEQIQVLQYILNNKDIYAHEVRVVRIGSKIISATKTRWRTLLFQDMGGGNYKFTTSAFVLEQLISVLNKQLNNG